VAPCVCLSSTMQPTPLFLGIPAFFFSEEEVRKSEEMQEFRGIPHFPNKERKFLNFLFLRKSHLRSGPSRCLMLFWDVTSLPEMASHVAIVVVLHEKVRLNSFFVSTFVSERAHAQTVRWARVMILHVLHLSCLHKINHQWRSFQTKVCCSRSWLSCSFFTRSIRLSWHFHKLKAHEGVRSRERWQESCIHFSRERVNNGAVHSNVIWAAFWQLKQSCYHNVSMQPINIATCRASWENDLPGKLGEVGIAVLTTIPIQVLFG